MTIIWQLCRAFLCSFIDSFVSLNSLFKDKLAHICVLYYSTAISISLFCCYVMCIYVLVCVTPFKIPRIGTKYLTDFKDLNEVWPLYLFMYFSTIVQTKKMCIFALLYFRFLDNTEIFLMQLNGNKDCQKEKSDPHFYNKLIPNSSGRSSIFQS